MRDVRFSLGLFPPIFRISYGESNRINEIVRWCNKINPNKSVVEGGITLTTDHLVWERTNRMSDKLLKRTYKSPFLLATDLL